MAWQDETALPFTPTGQIFFSPIIGSEVYVIDQEANFWKYNIATNQWTELASPTYDVNVLGIFIRTLVPSPDLTKLACISDGVADHRGGRRIEIYTIAANSWAASSQVQNMDDETPLSKGTVLSGIVWADEDTIWNWASEATTGVKNYARCIKYTISIDTFTIYSTLLNGTLTYAQCYSAAINSAGTIIYGSAIGAIREWYKYTIDTDTYASGGTLTSGRVFAVATDSDKLWYVTIADYRQGYIDITDDTENDNYFPENTDRDTGYGIRFGVSDDLVIIIAHARSAAPELMSFTSVVAPTVTTDPATLVEATAATLNGTLTDDGGEACDVRFQYGETSDYGIDTEWQPDKESVVAFEQAITGLDPNKTYHFRAQARNRAGTVNGADRTFTTLVATPTVTTDAATALSAIAATINGTLNQDGGEACECGFEWGFDTDYGITTPPQSKTTGETFSQVIGGLFSNTTYHFRAFATNSVGTSYGDDVSFTTALVISRAFALAREEL